MSKSVNPPSQASLSHDLEHNRARLTYYSRQKERAPSGPSKMLNKWITIYSERVEELERLIKREQARGLRTQLAAATVVPEVKATATASRGKRSR